MKMKIVFNKEAKNDGKSGVGELADDPVREGAPSPAARGLVAPHLDASMPRGAACVEA